MCLCAELIFAHKPTTLCAKPKIIQKKEFVEKYR